MVLAVVLFGIAGAAVAVLAVTVIRRDRRRRKELRAYAAQAGWWPIAGPAAGSAAGSATGSAAGSATGSAAGQAQVPGRVADDARSRRCKLALGARQGRHEMWMVWHQWVESTGDSGVESSVSSASRPCGI